MSLTNKVAQFDADSDLVNAWVHGPASGTGSTVTTDSGALRTPAKLIADNQANFDQITAQVDRVKTVDLAASSGSSLVGYGSKNVEDKLQETVSVKDFEHLVIAGDWTASIQAAINSSGNNAEILFPVGIYKVTSTLTLSSSKHWQKLKGTSAPKAGGGAGVSSLLDFSSLPLNTPAIVCGGRTVIEDLGIHGPGASIGGTGVGVTSNNEVELLNVSIQSFNIGCKLTTCYYSSLTGVAFRYNSLGLETTNGHNLRVTNCTFGAGSIGTRGAGQATGNCILQNNGEVSIFGCAFETYWGTGGYAIKSSGTSATLNVTDSYFEPYGDASNLAGSAILVYGTTGTINIKGCYAYVYYQDYFLNATTDAYNLTITSIGNTFINSSASATTLYALPTNGGYLATTTATIFGDNLSRITGTKPTYISPAIDGTNPGVINCHVVPPKVGLESNKILTHEFMGRPQANAIQTAAPSYPMQGVMYWADGILWKPFYSSFKPYPVVWDGSAYKQVTTSKVLSVANNVNKTLTVNESVLVVSATVAVTITLPASPSDGDTNTIKATGGANAVTVSGNGVTIEAAATRVLTAGSYEAITCTYTSYLNRWLVVGKV